MLGAVTLAAACLVLSVVCKRAPGDTRPNFVFYFPDEMRAESLGTYGHPITQTPNFDRFAAEGTKFDECHVLHTQCSPSRIAMVTGWYLHVLGHRTLDRLIQVLYSLTVHHYFFNRQERYLFPFFAIKREKTIFHVHYSIVYSVSPDSCADLRAEHVPISQNQRLHQHLARQERHALAAVL